MNPNADQLEFFNQIKALACRKASETEIFLLDYLSAILDNQDCNDDFIETQETDNEITEIFNYFCNDSCAEYEKLNKQLYESLSSLQSETIRETNIKYPEIDFDLPSITTGIYTFRPTLPVNLIPQIPILQTQITLKPVKGLSETKLDLKTIKLKAWSHFYSTLGFYFVNSSEIYPVKLFKYGRSEWCR
jgi:hypothetical protein